MANDLNQPFSPKAVCQTLMKKGLISRDQAKEILGKKETVRSKLENARKKRADVFTDAGGLADTITIVDVIAAMDMTRADKAVGPLDEDLIFQALADKWDVPYKKIDPLKLDLNVVTTTIPKTFARKHLVLPISVADGVLTIATPNPFNGEVMEDIGRVTNLKLAVVVSSKTDIIKLIDEFFGFKRSIAAAEDMFAGPTVDLGNLEQYVKLKSADELVATDQHIVNAVNHILLYAFDQKASDIHIEPKRDLSMVRMRIDGVLHTIHRLPKKVHNPIISRIKTLSRLDMAEKRRPQDGRIKTEKGGVEVEIRISTMPVAFGEKVVMRIMDPDILFQDLSGLGFSPEDLARYNRFVGMPHGITLVCGPTGSGKSTTLYSTLRKLSSPEINVVTIEDPIEMVHEDFNQIGVQPAAGVTFATILRTILRQDPDIIMVGEIRDLETARNAVQAALTGHLVLSTLHTNDAPSAIIRLLDLGVQSFLIQAALVGILGQRLVRKTCKYCSAPVSMDAEELNRLGLETGLSGSVPLQEGLGCVRCRKTGYSGRTGVYEVLPYTETIRALTTSDADTEALRIQARTEGMHTLRESAVAKMLDGNTTVKEVLRVTWENV
ncbi:MAG: type II/IV secretion system protein [Desulfobacterales bacterium]|nr:type II/IV secretion system protein [Desulfobacterales bacterium]